MISKVTPVPHSSLVSRLRIIGAFVVMPALALCQPDQATSPGTAITALPLSVEQQDVLDLARRYAQDYMSNLPNFVCRQVTRQFEAGRKADHWRKLETLGSRLVFSGGQEERTLETINDKPPGRVPRRPLQTEGEFGVLLSNVFGDSTKAVFSWSGWQTVRGKHVAVFDFMVDTAHSTLRLSLSDLARAVVPYHGSVFIDPESGVVWRITSSPFDIPPQIRTRSISTTIDYDSVTIAGRTHMLPVEASVALDTGSQNVLNRMEFVEYRKFEAESKITFSASDSDSHPAPHQ